jgi:hypothetical protein
MARINTKAGLRDYVKSQLGAPTINVEVTDGQIDQIIDDTVQKFTEYAYGTLEGSVIVQINGMGEYAMPDTMTNLIKLSKGSTSNITNFSANFGSGYVPNLWSEQFFTGSLTGDIIPGIIAISTTKAVLDKFFADDIVFNFNHLSKKLQVLENYNGPAILHYQYEYLADDSNDLVFNHEWIKAYTKAKVKELWGTVTGKYDQALVGGARINYDRLLSEAQQEIERLNEELLTKWSDPAPIDIA